MNAINILSSILNEDSIGDYIVTPAIAYFCFNSVDFDFEKDYTINEDIFSDVKKEQKNLRKKKISDITGTIYKLTSEQKRCLKYLKKKYGKSLVKEIDQYRKNTLAPYQVAKSYLEKSKAIYPKEVFGMTKEEYLKYKKSAEDKIANMRSNKYLDLTRDMLNISSKERKLDGMLGVISSNDDISDSALNKVFKKYDIYSTKYTDVELRAFQRHIENVDKLKKDVILKALTSKEVPQEDIDALRKAMDAVKTAKSELTSKDHESESNYNAVKSLSKKINGTDIPDSVKDDLQDILSGFEDVGVKITDKSFEQEYENFLMRERIRKDIKSDNDNKYVDDYKRNILDAKDDLKIKRELTISKMAKERQSKTLNGMEKKIYELKPSARPDTDRISDYVLKIREEDFFDPKYYQKSDKLKDAERKIDAEIKRFERGMEAKMEPKDFQLLKKYRLISNLITIKNANLNDAFKTNGEQTQEENK